MEKIKNKKTRRQTGNNIGRRAGKIWRQLKPGRSSDE